VIANSLWIVGSGDNIHFWIDSWLGEPLVDLLYIDLVYHPSFFCMIASFIDNGTWDATLIMCWLILT